MPMFILKKDDETKAGISSKTPWRSYLLWSCALLRNSSFTLSSHACVSPLIQPLMTFPILLSKWQNTQECVTANESVFSQAAYNSPHRAFRSVLPSLCFFYWHGSQLRQTPPSAPPNPSLWRNRFVNDSAAIRLSVGADCGWLSRCQHSAPVTSGGETHPTLSRRAQTTGDVTQLWILTSRCMRRSAGRPLLMEDERNPFSEKFFETLMSCATGREPCLSFTNSSRLQLQSNSPFAVWTRMPCGPLECDDEWCQIKKK